MVVGKKFKRKSQHKIDSSLPLDLEDEVEKFHKEREVLHLNAEDDATSESDEEGMLDISSSEEEDSVEDEDDFDTDDEIERETHLGRLAKQARELRSKIKISRGEAETDEEEEDKEKDETVGTGWGGRRHAYYDADVIDMEGSDEEDALAEEEAEAIRLHKEAMAGMQDEDFGVKDLSEEVSEENEMTLGETAKETIETVPRRSHTLGDAIEVTNARQDALEVDALVSELRECFDEIRFRFGPLLNEARKGELVTSEGLKFLESKHTLLSHYGACVAFFLLCKGEGRPVRDHPVVSRLVELRNLLNDLHSTDEKLNDQLEKLLAGIAYAELRDEAEEDVSSQDGEEHSQGTAEEDAEKTAAQLEPDACMVDEAAPERKRKRNRKTREDVKAELRKRMMEDLDNEKNHEVPVQLTRPSNKQSKTLAFSKATALDDFADEVTLTDDEGIAPSFMGHKANQKFGVDLVLQTAQEKHRQLPSGDAELPTRKSLSERRAQIDAIRARTAADDEWNEPHEDTDGEDEYYKAVKSETAKRKQARNEAFKHPDLRPPAEDPRTVGARRINRAIEKNRGLTPHRRKDLKNPRKKHRIKYAEATVRRKGQVQDMRKDAGAYLGETTGIKSRVSKSVKF